GSELAREGIPADNAELKALKQ
ncbi:MAG: hypothetical protein JWP42_895, partial [Pseudomonas sp.]|nr:hypothetical protein [Pseudomonas sp.]